MSLLASCDVRIEVERAARAVEVEGVAALEHLERGLDVRRADRRLLPADHLRHRARQVRAGDRLRAERDDVVREEVERVVRAGHAEHVGRRVVLALVLDAERAEERVVRSGHRAANAQAERVVSGDRGEELGFLARVAEEIERSRRRAHPVGLDRREELRDDLGRADADDDVVRVGHDLRGGRARVERRGAVLKRREIARVSRVGEREAVQRETGRERAFEPRAVGVVLVGDGELHLRDAVVVLVLGLERADLILQRDRLDRVRRRRAPEELVDSAERGARRRRRDDEHARRDRRVLNHGRHEPAAAGADDRWDADLDQVVRRVGRVTVVGLIVALDERERTRFAAAPAGDADDGLREVVHRELDAVHARDAARLVDARQREETADHDRVLALPRAIDLGAIRREERLAGLVVFAADRGLAAVARDALGVGRARAADARANADVIGAAEDRRAAGVEPASGAIRVDVALDAAALHEQRAGRRERQRDHRREPADQAKDREGSLQSACT